MLILGLLSEQSMAQVQKQPGFRWSVQAEIVTQTTGTYAESYRIPQISTQFSGGYGGQLGVEYLYINRKSGQIFQQIIILGYGSKTETGWGAVTYLGYRYPIKRAYAGAMLGIGYLNAAFRKGRELQDANGDFFSEQFKIGGLTPSAAVGAGYRIANRYDVYLRYYHHFQLQSELNNAAFRLHRNLNLGIAIKI